LNIACVELESQITGECAVDREAVDGDVYKFVSKYQTVAR
jgi:hypothetical protein